MTDTSDHEKTPDEIFQFVAAATGKDPKAIQAMTKFIDMDNNDERSYYPTQLTALAIAQLRIYGKANYPDDEWNEYDFIADALSIGFMGYKGFKSEQYKDITSGQPNLDKLKGIPEETKKGILASLLNRGKSE